MSEHPKKERSLIIIKPDGVQRALIGEIVARFERTGLKFIAMKLLVPQAQQCWVHYNKDEEWFLKKEPGEKILYDIRSSRIVPEVIEAAGGTAIQSRAGHTLIKQLFRKEKAIFAEERSGHFYFRDFFYSESAFLVFLYLLATLSKTDEKMSTIINRYNKYFATPELNFTVKDRSPERLREIAKNFSDAKDVSWLDGIFVIYDDWWFNLRPSNTEPLMRLFVEGKNPEIVNQKLELLKRLLAE